MAQRRFRPGWALTVSTAVALVMLLALGTWQVQRLGWKTALIERARQGLLQAPGPLPASDFDAAAVDFRPLTAEGSFLPGITLAVGSAARDGRVGADLVAPLRLRDGRTVLVDLGWLPADRLDPAERARLVPAGEVRIEGVARWRGDAAPGWFTPTPDLVTGRFLAWDLAAMEAVVGAALEPVVLFAGPGTTAGDLPQAVAVAVDYTNNHLGYVITWYGLALALVAVYVLMGLERGRS